MLSWCITYRVLLGACNRMFGPVRTLRYMAGVHTSLWPFIERMGLDEV